MSEVGKLPRDLHQKLTEYKEFSAENKECWSSLRDMVKGMGEGIQKNLHGLVYDSLSSNAHALPLTLEEWYSTYEEDGIVIGRTLAAASEFPQLDIPCVCFAGALSCLARTFELVDTTQLDLTWAEIKKLTIQR